MKVRRLKWQNWKLEDWNEKDWKLEGQLFIFAYIIWFIIGKTMCQIWITTWQHDHKPSSTLGASVHYMFVIFSWAWYVIIPVIIISCVKIRTKLPFALFGQINQPFAILSKLNREMPLFWKSSLKKKFQGPIVTFCNLISIKSSYRQSSYVRVGWNKFVYTRLKKRKRR